MTISVTMLQICWARRPAGRAGGGRSTPLIENTPIDIMASNANDYYPIHWKLAVICLAILTIYNITPTEHNY